MFTVDILLKATGDAPIIKQKKWTVDRSKRMAYVAEFMKRLLKFRPEESLVSFGLTISVNLCVIENSI